MLFIYEALRQKLPGTVVRCLQREVTVLMLVEPPVRTKLGEVDLNDMLHTDELQEGLTLHFLLSLEHLKSLLFVIYSESHL